ncbi:MAG TPA: NADH-quinone oxidoreductase subunit NuoF [Thermomicrobiales bacterium]|nr:NADH-quinone oxidoreductase subunit NuoF [Thermomicrobiales bacterium]
MAETTTERGDAPVRILTRNSDVPNMADIEVAVAHGAYQGLAKALREYEPAQVTEIVSNATLLGRGGAGFPAGRKWSFIPKAPGQKYLTVNADESEPGTFSNRELMETDPHLLLEGIALCCYAVGISQAFIYIRGEYAFAAAQLERAIAGATAQHYLGDKILGSDFSCAVFVFRGAGAYICGEETALLESIEGNRPMPRSRPPFPAVAGLYGKPTVINNVETIANVPQIVLHGADWYKSFGTPTSPGTKVYSLSGHVRRPGNYELPLGVPLRELIYTYGGGVPGDRRVKAVLPSGAAAPWVPGDQLDLPMDYDAPKKIGTILGSASVIVMDESTSIPHATLRLIEFFNHESCGKCTPCREGTLWLVKTMRRICADEGLPEDLDLLERVCGNIGGRVLCALGDFAISPILSSLKYFRHEYEALIPGLAAAEPIAVAADK